MPSESQIVERILSHLRAKYGRDWYGFKVHGDQFTVNQPDIVGCVKGAMLVIECKRQSETSRAGQTAVQERWAQAGALVVTDATSWNDVMAVLQYYGLSE